MKLRKIAKFLIIIIAIFSIGVFLLAKAGYRHNVTPSYPLGIYKTNFEKEHLKKNDMVLACPPDNKYTKQAFKKGLLPWGFCPGGYVEVIKKIAGTPRDKIVIFDYVYINNTKMKKSKVIDWKAYYDKNLFLANKQKTEFSLSVNEYFLMSDYDQNSFDSRYYGAVNKSLIVGTIRPILIFKEIF